MKVMIDPGHGGVDSGAIGPSGTKEKDIALITGLALGGWLGRWKTHFDVVYTRMSDRAVSLPERVIFANSFSVDLFLSVHCNGFHDPSVYGFEVYTSPGQTMSDLLASEIWAQTVKTFPGIKGRLDYSDGDSDKEAEFYVLRKTPMPAVLVELGFITHPDREIWLADAVNQAKFARAIGTAVSNWEEQHLPTRGRPHGEDE